MESWGVGDVLAGHRMDEVIGQGGMGVVYRATHLGLDREVALKVISPALAHDENFRERFKRESRIAASLRHPHIVTIYDAGEDERLLYITMEYVIGKDLSDVIAERGRLTPEAAVEILQQVASALDAAHSRGLVHRDVKPANVLIQSEAGSARPHAYLTDFGLTRHASSVGGLTGTGQWVGTLNYVAPEQLEGAKVDGRTDVYSLGCVLFETLSGQIPFERENDIAKLWAHVHDEPPRLTDLVPGAPSAFDEVIATALSKDGDERFDTAEELAIAAKEALDSPPVSPRKPKRAGTTERAGGKPATRSRLAPSTARPPRKKPPAAGPTEGGKSTPHPERTGDEGLAGGKPTALRRRRLVVGAAVAALFAFGVGLLLAPGGGKQASAEVASGNVALMQPDGWTRDLSGGREIEGLQMDDVLAFDYPPSMGTSILRSGSVTDPGEPLDPIPANLAKRFKAGPEAREVDLGDDLSGLIYEGQTRSKETVQLLMLPTEDGFQGVACEAPKDDFAAIQQACESAMASVRLVKTEPAPVGPNQALTSALAAALTDLGKAQASSADGLDAGDPDEQADAAVALADAYGKAAGKIDDLDPPSAVADAVKRLGGAFDANAQAIGALAEAARKGDEAAYKEAQTAARNAGKDAASAIDDLGDAGYEFKGSGNG